MIEKDQTFILNQPNLDRANCRDRMGAFQSGAVNAHMAQHHTASHFHHNLIKNETQNSQN